MLQLNIFTGVLFFTQLFVCEIAGIVQRKPGYEWITWACGVAFFSVLISTIVLKIMKNRRERKFYKNG